MEAGSPRWETGTLTSPRGLRAELQMRASNATPVTPVGGLGKKCRRRHFLKRQCHVVDLKMSSSATSSERTPARSRKLFATGTSQMRFPNPSKS